ncbi:hypothetical protein F5887DRAFT_1077009 [Amanita rubescens]|nr:hypothetical protein F5887DRAFT_1077009 [Amanita rubescens]
MSDRSDEPQSASGSRERKTLRSWWKGAKDFVINKSDMCDTGDNAKIFNFKAKTVNVVFGDSHPAPGGALCVDIGKAQEPQQTSDCSQIPVAKDGRSLGGEESVNAREQAAAAPQQINSTERDRSISEPEATATYAEPDPPSNNSFATADCLVDLSSTYSAQTGAQIYSLNMLIRGLGYPLYMPAPSSHLPLAYRTHGICYELVNLNLSCSGNSSHDYKS